MTSDIVLGSALRGNLLSLQNTQNLIDRTQIRLATGLRVNSALDNPQNFFRAQSLNNRAGDLARLLDGIGQSIRAIQQADNGVKGITSLINQADAIGTQAREALAAGERESRVSGNLDLRNITDLTNLSNVGVNSAIDLSLVDDDGIGIQTNAGFVSAALRNGGNIAAITDTLSQVGATGINATDTLQVSVTRNDGTVITLNAAIDIGAGATDGINEIINAINNDDNIGIDGDTGSARLVRASFDTTTGQFRIDAVDSSVSSVSLTATNVANGGGGGTALDLSVLALNGDTTSLVTGTANGASASQSGGANNSRINITAGLSTEALLTKINDIRDISSGQRVLNAALNASGQLEIKTLNGENLRLRFIADTTAAVTSTAAALAQQTGDTAFAAALGFGSIVRTQGTGLERQGGTDPTNIVGITAISSASLQSSVLKIQDPNDASNFITANASSQLSTLRNSQNTLFSIENGDTVRIRINGDTQSAAIALGNNQTIQGLVDAINNDASVKGLLRASYDDVTGRINIRSTDASVQDVQFTFTESGAGAAGLQTFFGFGSGLSDGLIGSGEGIGISEAIRLSSAAGDLANLEKEYNKIRTQIDQFVRDTDFGGTNLLNGDNLLTVFNNDRSSTLLTEGVVFTSAGLGITEANFGLEVTTAAAQSEVRAALEAVRAFGAQISNDLSIIQTRQQFSQSTINTLTSAAEDLTIADQNEEGANLLALQTRQQLGVTSLSLASQSQQSVLRLF